jgi:hypothetical protein
MLGAETPMNHPTLRRLRLGDSYPDRARTPDHSVVTVSRPILAYREKEPL